MTNKTIKHWGYHLILDCGNCDPLLINNKDHIELFVNTLIKKIKMVGHGKPIIEFLLPETENQGYSLLQMITTSHIAAHFVNKNNTAYFDVFSCKEFDIEVVVLTIQQFFKPTTINKTYISRQAS